jgi:hypothetical protein
MICPTFQAQNIAKVCVLSSCHNEKPEQWFLQRAKQLPACSHGWASGSTKTFSFNLWNNQQITTISDLVTCERRVQTTFPCWHFPDIVSIPSTTLPKTTCFPSNSEQSPKEMKNCVPAYHSKQNCSGMHKLAPIYCRLEYVQILKSIHLDMNHNNDTWQLPCVLENFDHKDQCNQCGCNLQSSKRSRSSCLCTVIIIAV